MISAASRWARAADAAALPVLLLCLLAGCGSSPRTRFYTLTPVEPSSRLVAGNDAPLKVSAVHIPSVLDRTSIVRGETNYQLDISSQERWGADLGEMIRRTLTQDLQQRLPEGMVVPGRSPAPENTRGLVVDIVYFGPDGPERAKLEATWTLLEGSPPRVVLQRTAHLTEPGTEPPQRARPEPSGSAAAQAAAMSALLGRLADEIASGVSQLREARN